MHNSRDVDKYSVWWDTQYVLYVWYTSWAGGGVVLKGVQPKMVKKRRQSVDHHQVFPMLISKLLGEGDKYVCLFGCEGKDDLW
jgi:hypothetical protein